ncbi:MAG: pyridoxal phosphate-dependent aminotransferase [Anaerolineae bacterium]
MSNSGRFPTMSLPSLFKGPRSYDLSESTTADLKFGDLIDLIGEDAVRNLDLGYGDLIQGSLEFRQEISRHCGDIPADMIITTQGASLALYLVASELGGAGSHAIIPAPYYLQAYNTLKANGWEVSVVQNRLEDGYSLNIEAISAQLNEQTKLVSVASSQNPSGVSIPIADIENLLSMMAEKSPAAYLLVDETYREAAFEEANILPSAASLSFRVLTCASISKAYGTPGLRAGWLTVPDETLRQKMITAKQNIVICDSSLTEKLATGVLKHAPTILKNQREHLAPALELVKQWQASEREYLDWAVPDAGALCCMRLNAARFVDADLEKFWQALAHNDTIVRPGLQFGSDIRHFRLGFGHVTFEQLEVGLQNISKALHNI